MRSLARLIVFLFPACRLKNILLRRLGVRIGVGVSVGPCLVDSVEMITLADGSRIGPFNVFRHLRAVDIGASGVIGQWNWFSAARPLASPEDRLGRLQIGSHSAVTSRHYMDATGSISIGNFSTVAGVRSTFLTHGIDWRANRQVPRAIVVGDYCLVSSNVQIAPGSDIPPRTVIGMGATVSGSGESDQLWLQPRARPVNEVRGSYFSRTRGFVD